MKSVYRFLLFWGTSILTIIIFVFGIAIWQFDLITMNESIYQFLIFWEIFMMAIFMFAIWQHDLITVGPVWSEGWCHSHGRFADDPFQCWIWKTTVGWAYDVTFFLMFVAYWGALIGLILLVL